MIQDQHRAPTFPQDTTEAGFLTAVEKHDSPFVPVESGSGLEFQAVQEVDGRPNRARIKLFRVEGGPLDGTPVLFFFKTSRIPFSRDRYSYGVCLLQGGDLPIGRWLDYPASGFDPDRAPQELRKAFPFTIPE